MITEKLIFKVPYEVSTFHPSDLTGGQLYLRKDQATASSWVSDIGTARNFVQATSTQQPTISTNSVDYDGVNDYQKVTESAAFGSDTLGFVISGFYWDGVNNGYVLTSGDEAGFLSFWWAGVFNGYFTMAVRNLAGVITIVRGATLLNVGYNYAYVRSDGVSNYFSTNGGAEVTGVVVSGSNNGEWFNYSENRDNLAVGARVTNSISYRKSEINKLYYNNTALTSGEIADVNTFFSDPTNY